eukprot:02576.XXX_19377_19553_1 [CDS] Oithona nana genome sequencing.
MSIQRFCLFERLLAEMTQSSATFFELFLVNFLSHKCDSLAMILFSCLFKSVTILVCPF